MRCNRSLYGLCFIFIRFLSLLAMISLVLCSIFIPITAVNADGDGWYVEGQPVIEKENFVNDKCYFQQSLNITNGSASGSVTWSDCDGGKCGGTYTGSMTWTLPPAYMQPGTKINFSMTAKTSVSNNCGSRSIGSGGWIKAEGTTIVKAIDETSPSASGTYMVPNGAAGQKLQMWATIQVANLHGTVYYNYVYKGTGTAITPSVKPLTSEDPSPGQLIDKLPIPEKGETLAFITEVDGNPIYVSADPADIPPSQRKWVKIMPGKYKYGNPSVQVLGKGWIVRTPAGSEAIITYKTTAFVIMQPKSWFVVRQEEMATPAMKEIFGNLVEGIARFYYDPKKAEAQKKFELETDLVVVGIKGTDFTIETNHEGSTVKVIAGTVEITHKILNQVVSISGGQSITVTQQTIDKVSPFDVAYEKARWISFNSMLSDFNSGLQSRGEKTFTVGPLSCFIATAAYGSETAEELDTLRAFRDKKLMNSELGRWFVDTYYRVSPPLAHFIAEHEELRITVREAMLNPIVNLLKSTESYWRNN